MKGFLLFFTVVAGVMMPLQAGINSLLGNELKSSLLSAFVSFVVGMLGLIVVCLLGREPWGALRSVTQVPWWYLSGGFMGAFLVTLSILAAPRIGAVNMFVFLLLGQMVASLVFDHFGWFGFSIHPINIWRVLGIVLVVIGVVIIRKF